MKTNKKIAFISICLLIAAIALIAMYFMAIHTHGLSNTVICLLCVARIW